MSTHQSKGRRQALQRLLTTGCLLGSIRSVEATTQSGQRKTPAVSAQSRLIFPDDFGSHPETRIEWWYLTGVLRSQHGDCGFQVTFFRNRLPIAASPSRFSPQQLIMAHAAITDLAGRRLRHDQRLAREGFGRAQASQGNTAVRIDRWRLMRQGDAGASGSIYQTSVQSDKGRFSLDLTLTSTQALLLQGISGWSRKGPQPEQASHYYSQPHLEVSGSLTLDDKPQAVSGTAWLDHEWSDSLLDPEATGWDWIGINLDDGSALTAFQLRRPDGSPLWAGGSFRPRGGTARNFEPHEVSFQPLRTWRSPRSPGTYPVEWQVRTPAGEFLIRSLLDDQELGGQQGTGIIYWEGLSDCLDSQGRPLGRGYLEMTGYASRLRL